jgi:hypothetical protein
MKLHGRDPGGELRLVRAFPQRERAPLKPPLPGLGVWFPDDDPMFPSLGFCREDLVHAIDPCPRFLVQHNRFPE